MSTATTIPSKAEVRELNRMDELVELHNRLNPDEPVKSFQSKEKGREAILNLLESETPEKSPKVGKFVKSRTRFDPPADAEAKPPRRRSKRADLLEHLQGDGLESDDIQHRYDWKPRDMTDAFRLLAKQNGYAVYYDGDAGVWKAAAPESGEEAASE